jgi:hypothetical protein
MLRHIVNHSTYHRGQVASKLKRFGRCLHRVPRNPSKRGKTRILAVVLHPEDVKDIVIFEKDKK